MALSSLSEGQRYLIEGPEGKLELVLEPGVESGPLADSAYYAVVCHPHPLYGGTMGDQVVATLASVYRELGVPVVRFNFRGVGASEGEHDKGQGEVDDLCAVAAWARQQSAGNHLLLAGYSFGSVVAAGSDAALQIEHLTLVAPPVEHYAFAPDGGFRCPAVVILGEQDELVDFQGTKTWAANLSSPVKVLGIAGASHFFHGQSTVLHDQLTPLLLQAL